MSSVLVCEDDAAIGGLIVALLSRGAIACEWVGSGNAALQRLRQRSYDAVVLDLMMGEGSGFEVIEWMRAEAPYLLRRVTIVTASTAALKSDIRHEVHAVLLKPFEIHELLATVRASVSRADGEPLATDPA